MHCISRYEPEEYSNAWQQVSISWAGQDALLGAVFCFGFNRGQEVEAKRSQQVSIPGSTITRA